MWTICGRRLSATCDNEYLVPDSEGSSKPTRYGLFEDLEWETGIVSRNFTAQPILEKGRRPQQVVLRTAGYRVRTLSKRNPSASPPN